MTAREARNAYMRDWRKRNKEKARAIQQRFWERKARQIDSERHNGPPDVSLTSDKETINQAQKTVPSRQRIQTRGYRDEQ